MSSRHLPLDPQKPMQPLLQSQTGWARVVNAWVRLTGPAAEHFTTSVADQERLRRSRLLCALFTLIPFAVLANVPIALTKPLYWLTLLTLCLVGTIAILLNRQGRVTASGLLFLLSIDLTLVVVMVTQPHGLRNGNIPDFDLFVLTLLIAGTVLPRITLPFLAILNCIIIFTIFTVVPHDALLKQEILVNQKGLGYAELSDAFLLQIAGALIAYLSSWSMSRALTRANRAEELAEARALLNAQNQRELEQKQRLEHGIHVLKETQARVANGDYSARARLQDNELVPLAMSFNLLVERLSKFPRLEQDYRRMELAIQHVLEMRTAYMHGEALKPFQPTGTLIDYLYPVIEQSINQNALLSQHMTGVEQVIHALQQQNTELERLDGVLLQTRSVAQFSSSKAPSAGSPSTNAPTMQDRGSRSLQASADHSSPLFNQLNDRLNNLLEEGLRHCARASELGKQCSQELKKATSLFRHS